MINKWRRLSDFEMSRCPSQENAYETKPGRNIEDRLSAKPYGGAAETELREINNYGDCINLGQARL